MFAFLAPYLLRFISNKALPYILIGLLVLGIGTYFVALKVTIHKQETRIAKLEKQNLALQMDYETEKHNNKLLVDEIARLNKVLEKIEVANQQVNTHLNKIEQENTKLHHLLKSQAFTASKEKVTCQDVLNLSHQISELKYEDF